ncbi:MAG TPA: glycosyltransferase [Firmicutes bacterium]|nr:glycosyltransferase [Bacillota bacterium]
MENYNLYVLLVIYNQNGSDSPACEVLRTRNDVGVLVVDNSTADYHNAEYCQQNGFAYLSMDGNKGLSKAYNRGIRYLKEHTRATHIVLLDDDTTLGDDYFSVLRQAIIENPDTRIFLPLVKDEVGYLSPCRINGYAVSRIQSPKELDRINVTGINSGMALALSIFDAYQYDETYFLDYIDHAFLRDMKRRGEPIRVIGTTLQQRFSGNDHSNYQATLTRYSLFKRDFRLFCSDTVKGKVYADAFLVIRRIRLFLSAHLRRKK